MPDSFTCPRCGMTSHNPNDVANGYCGNCHAYTGVTGTFVCAQCGGTFEKGCSDEEAQAEALEVFGAPVDEPVMVCDDCYQQIQEWGEATGALRRERERLAAASGYSFGPLRFPAAAEHPFDRLVRDELTADYDRRVAVEIDRLLGGHPDA